MTPDPTFYRSADMPGLVFNPGENRVIVYPDPRNPKGLMDSFLTYRSYGFGFHDGALPIMDKADRFKDPQPAYDSLDAYLDDRHRVDPDGKIEMASAAEAEAIRLGIIASSASRDVRYKDKVYRAWDGGGRYRELFTDDPQDTFRAPWKALVYLSQNKRVQVLFEGEVCDMDPLFRTLTRRNGDRLRMERDDPRLTYCADQPVGPRVKYRGRICHYKWATKPYALIYDPSINADRKVTIKALAWIDPRPEVF